MEIGESFVGSGPNAAHVNTVLGSRDGPVAVAWATALATPSAGHAPFLAVLQPGLPVKPFTLFVPKAAHRRIGSRPDDLGPAQAGVASGVADAVAAGVVPEEEAEQALLIAAVWVDPAADDADAVYTNNREATRSALVIARSGLPAARDAVAKRADAWNPFFRVARRPAKQRRRGPREQLLGEQALEAGRVAGDEAPAQPQPLEVAEDVRPPRRVGLELHRLLGPVAGQQRPTARRRRRRRRRRRPSSCSSRAMLPRTSLSASPAWRTRAATSASYGMPSGRRCVGDDGARGARRR